MKFSFRNKHILVTGGTGSIGSEIVRQLLPLKPAVVRVYSRDETKHYMLKEELGDSVPVRYLVGDVRDRYRLRRAFEGIDFVFHTAALKHVPSCEYNPFEAVQTNVLGTQNVIDAAIDAGVSRLLAISTDKAVDPTFTMGATKLLAEKIVVATQAWLKRNRLRLGCVRFGNVLGSRGSVVPIVREQVLRGRKITITDPNMTRFVMTIRQAAGLTLKAMTQMEGGEVFILEHMSAVTVEDLVRAIAEETAATHGIRLRPNQFAIIRTRVGEKLHHRLLSDEELVRAERREDMFVVFHPVVEPRGAKRPTRIPLEKYLSNEAPPRSRAWIRRVLREEKLV